MLKIALVCFDRPAVLKLQKPYAVLLISEGEGGLILNARKVDLIPGRVFLLREEVPVMLAGSTLTGQLIEFQEVMLNTFLLNFTTHRGKGLFDPAVALPYSDLNSDAQVFLMGLITQLGSEMDAGTSALIFRHYLFVLLRHVNREIEREAVLVSKEEQQIALLLALLDEHYRTSRKTGFYASKMGLHARQLNDFTHKLFDKRFFELLMERIFAEADVLLIENKLSVKNIAYDLGFNGPNHFSLYYLRYKGCTPGGFRRSMVNKSIIR